MSVSGKIKEMVLELESELNGITPSLRLLAVLAGEDVDAFAFIKERGFGSFALFSAEPAIVGGAIGTLARTADFPCVKFISECRYTAENFGIFTQFENIKEIKDFDPNTPIVFCEPYDSYSEDVRGNLEELSYHVWSLVEVLLYALDMALIFKPLFDRVDTKLVVVRQASTWEINNRSDWEEKRQELEKLHMEGRYEDALEASKQYVIKYSDLDYADENYFYELYRNYVPLVMEGGKEIRADVSSTYVNSQNGFRYVTDKPQNPNRTVWCFGNSVCYGNGVEDRFTIQSALQRILNQKVPEQKIEVVNFANIQHANLGKCARNAIQALPIKRDDIIVVIYGTDSFLTRYMLKEAYFAETIFLEGNDFFQRPHDLGEIFTDSCCHMNRHGYQHYAEFIYDAMDKEGIITGNSNKPCVQPSVKPLAAVLPDLQSELSDYISSLSSYRTQIGAVVMNCNPFTLGHRYLIEESAKNADKLFVFIVEEDRSAFPFADRIELARRATADLGNVVVIPSGKFIISSRTFEAYFTKAELQDKEIDPSYDIELFAGTIAPALGLTVRFAGEEPLDNVTRQYNDAMAKLLPGYGLRFEVIPRKEHNGEVISASRVRKLLEDKNFDAISMLVPDVTMKYLRLKYA